LIASSLAMPEINPDSVTIDADSENRQNYRGASIKLHIMVAN